MTVAIVLLALGGLVLLVGLLCWCRGVALGTPAQFIGGMVAFGLTLSGIFFLTQDLLNAAARSSVAHNEPNPAEPSNEVSPKQFVEKEALQALSEPLRQRLPRLHQSTVATFVERPDFGIRRMDGFRPDALRQPNLVLANPNQLRMATQELEAVKQSESVHLNLQEVLRRRDLESGAGEGNSDGKSAWTVSQVQLVGLTKNPKPVVYLSDHLPKMDKAHEVPTRALDEFEIAALEALNNGEELKVEQRGEEIRILGPIRADARCVACHAKEGQMLGAFSYRLTRAPVKK